MDEGIPLIDRNPTTREKKFISNLISIFFDGEGVSRLSEKGVDLYYPNYTQIERVIAEMVGGFTVESKLKFDILVNLPNNKMLGVEVKSKGFSRNDYRAILSGEGRLYLELNNSPAKQHQWLRDNGISLEVSNRADFDPKVIGEHLLDLYDNWNEEDGFKTGSEYSRTFELERSRFIVLSYQKKNLSTDTEGKPKVSFYISSLKLNFKREGIKWFWNSDKCLRGTDADNGTLYDWYPFSGGQFKFYPLAKESDFSSEEIIVRIPPFRSLRSKAIELFGE
tara:strand:+ start:782 stop:1618 length:837 start_codon:yes stop_codon:yes gene_type:complete